MCCLASTFRAPIRRSRLRAQDGDRLPSPPPRSATSIEAPPGPFPRSMAMNDLSPKTLDPRIDASRRIRAPRGTQLSCRSWLTEAAYRMIQNNLDPEVAEHPQELVVYGGIGRAARDWASLRPHPRGAAASWATTRRCSSRAGKPVGVFTHPRRRAARAHRQLEPRAALGHVGALQRARPQGPHDVRADDRGLVDLHRLPGHRAGHLRDVLLDGGPALRRRAGGPLDPHRGASAAWAARSRSRRPWRASR